MHLTLKSIQQNSKALDLYKLRRVKIFNSKYGFWYAGIIGYPLFPVMLKSLACVLILDDVLKIFLLSGGNIEVYFEDTFGEEKPHIKDFGSIDVYNCPTIKIDIK